MSKGFHSRWIPQDSCPSTKGIYPFFHFICDLCVLCLSILAASISVPQKKGKIIILTPTLMQLDEMLEKRGTKIDKVLNFAIDDAILEERITGRWIHPSSGRTYHTKFAPPKAPGVDDVRHMMILNSLVFEI